jgi:toxin ParE1/3/4
VIVGYALHQQAQDDLEAIWIYSYREWGVEQADQYIRALLS